MQEQMFYTPSEWIDFNLKASDSVPLPKLESNLHGGGGCPHPRVQVSLLDTDNIWRRRCRHLPWWAGQPPSLSHELGLVKGQREELSCCLLHYKLSSCALSPVTCPGCFLVRGASVCLHSMCISSIKGF